MICSPGKLTLEYLATRRFPPIGKGRTWRSCPAMEHAPWPSATQHTLIPICLYVKKRRRWGQEVCECRPQRVWSRWKNCQTMLCRHCIEVMHQKAYENKNTRQFPMNLSCFSILSYVKCLTSLTGAKIGLYRLGLDRIVSRICSVTHMQLLVSYVPCLKTRIPNSVQRRQSRSRNQVSRFEKQVLSVESK